jgi:phosphoribosyl-ATP pyrophosphohydrolase/phosphoribosyl-AMP cyclohydrolase
MMIIPEMVRFNRDGLVPVITQDIRTDEVLMLAYMNEEALKETIRTGMAHYYSRSRQKLWLKGETSGHYQRVRSISVDCDGDTLLMKVEQTGVACHTGHHSCFFTKFDASGSGKSAYTAEAAADSSNAAGTGSDSSNTADTGAGNDTADTGADNNTNGMRADSSNMDTGTGDGTTKGERCKAGPEVLGEVFGVILDRQANPKEGSYTNYLFTKGLDKILKKIGEEAAEVIIASKNGSPSEIRAEVADLFYHIMVLLADRGMSLHDVFEELKERA